jgi:pyrimidine oxygenase
MTQLAQLAEPSAARASVYPPQADPAKRPLQHFRPKTLPKEEGGIMLGVFLPCQSWGQWPTMAESEAEWTYVYNRRVTLLAEEIGMHFALPAARWKGIVGDRVDWRGVSLDTITLASALLEATSTITVMSTIHTNVFHPVVGAKMCADLDQISGGRFALNIVSGWNEDEFKSLSIPLIVNRKDRYAYTREWLHVARQLWQTGECSFDGRFFQLEGAVARPLPVQTPGPVLVNAGQSYTGMSFAAEDVDYLFSYGLSAPKFRDIVKEKSSGTGFVGLKKVLLRRTKAEAETMAAEILDKIDVGAVTGMRMASGAISPDLAAEWSADRENIRAAVFEDGFIGSPESVARDLAEWIVQTRPNGICLTLYDYVRELELFAELMPILSELLHESGIHIIGRPAARSAPA